MFTIQLFLYFPADWQTGDEQNDGAVTASQTASGREMVTITLEDMWKSFHNLGVRDNRLRLMVETSPPGAMVKVLQNCRMPERLKNPSVPNDPEKRNADAIASTQKTIKSLEKLETKEKEIAKRISAQLKEEGELQDRLQFLIGKIADIQQKMDESCWNAAEPERGIRDAEEDLFALED